MQKPFAVLALFLLSIFSGCVGMKPEPDGVELYSYITEESSYKNWEIWPGRDRLDSGREPHGSLFTTYVTDDAFSAIRDKSGSLPHGSMVVKENYNADRELTVITLMYKVKGYDAGNNDWFWARYLPEGEVVEEGKVEACIECHGKKRDNDYIWTEELR